jgi:hypothetical protein
MTNVKTRSEWRTEGAFTNLTTSTPRQTERDNSDEATTRAKIQIDRALHNSRMCTARMAWVTYEPGFISAISDSEIKFSVDLSRGTCSETKSDLARSSAFETCGEMRVNQTGGRTINVHCCSHTRQQYTGVNISKRIALGLRVVPEWQCQGQACSPRR